MRYIKEELTQTYRHGPVNGICCFDTTAENGGLIYNLLAAHISPKFLQISSGSNQKIEALGGALLSMSG